MEFCYAVRPDSFSLDFENSVGLCSGRKEESSILKKKNKTQQSRNTMREANKIKGTEKG